MKKVNKIFAIGDVHGCYEEMMLLFKKLPLNPKKDLVVFLGDYMDRGLDSKKVVTQLIKWHELYPHWVFLYGNHEDIFKNWLEGGQKYQEDNKWSCFLGNGGRDTLLSYIMTDFRKNLFKENKFPKKHLDFLFNETKMMYETKDYVFVHAGLVPELPISEHLTEEVYKNAMLWGREKFINSDWDWSKKVIFGHTPAYKAKWGIFGQPIIMKNKIGIDGAVCSSKLGANLIAIELPLEKFYFQESLI